MLSAVALGTFAYSSPMFYETALYAFSGSHTVGWYSGLNDHFADGHWYFSYAYRVGGVTYGGRGSYQDANSSIYYRNVGDPIGVSYLRRKPWVSTLESVEWNLKIAWRALVTLAAVFLLGIGLSVSWRPEREHAFNNPR